MRLGLARRGYSPSGGAERYLARFAAAARAAGHEPVLFGSQPWPVEAWSGPFVAVQGSSPRAFADGLRRARRECDLLFSLERVWECDAYRAGDGLHSAWLERRREFEPAWRAWFRARQGKHRELLELEQAVLASAGVIIANSNMVAGEIAARCPGASGRVRVVHNGLPGSWFDGWQPTVRGPEWRVLFVGSGWERKGLRFAMAAIEQVRGAAELLVAGAGRRSGLPRSGRTRFLGEVGNLRELLAAADVFVLPTIYDPFSNASLEAMGAGVPVVTTQANGFAEVMRPGGIDGVALQSPGDVEGIARAIESLIPAETEERRAARREAARAHTIERNLRETLAALGVG